LGDVSAPSPFNGGATGQRFAKQEYYIAYAEDEWKIRPNLTLNYGLRYEYYTPLREDRNLQVLFNITNGTFARRLSKRSSRQRHNFGPRLSMTWSPNPKGDGFFGGGRTVLRGGFGIFYGPGQTEDQIQPIESDRISSTFTSNPIFAEWSSSGFPLDSVAAVAFFTNPANVNTRAVSAACLLAGLQNSREGLSVHLLITAGVVLRNSSDRSVCWQPGTQSLPAQYRQQDPAGSDHDSEQCNIPAGVGVVNVQDVNTGRITAVRTVREFSIISGNNALNPFAEVDYKTSGGDDSYNAFQMTLARRITTGLTLNSQYTFSRSFGNTAGSNEARTSAIPDNFEADRGYNNFDVRHTFNFSALYKLPFGKGTTHDFGTVGNAFLGNWEIGGIINARSGLPIEVGIVRPDVVMQCAAGHLSGHD
jgi:hypothetical protein